MLESILIVDDEPFQRKGLKNIILSKRPGIHIETVRNGRLALEQIAQSPPDLVITDIRMPIMDGLELAEQIQTRFPSVHVVLVSAYQEFEYAKQAIRFGVLDYLIKPYKSEDIDHLLRQVDRSVASASLLSKKAYLGVLVSHLLAGTLTQPETETLLQRLKPDLQRSGCIVNCDFCYPPSDEHFYSISIGELIPKIGDWLTHEVGENLIDGSSYKSEGLCFFLPGCTDQNARPLMEKLQDHLLSKFRLGSNIGISENCAHLFENAHETAKHAAEACSYRFYQSPGCLTLYRDIAGAISMPLPPMADYEESLYAAVGQCDLDGIHTAFNKIKNQLMKKPYHYPGVAKHQLLTSTFSVLHRYENQLYATELNKLQNDAYTEFFNIRSLESLVRSCDKILCTVSAQAGLHDSQGHDQIVQQCILWIGENIGREISLTDAAEHFHFNGSYFSSLIKQKTGMSYGQYVFSLRMQEARRLLRQTDEKVQSIALRVGYRDPGYFNRVFKRENGITPDQYRRRASG